MTIGHLLFDLTVMQGRPVALDRDAPHSHRDSRPQAQRRRGLVGSQCTRRCAQWLSQSMTSGVSLAPER